VVKVFVVPRIVLGCVARARSIWILLEVGHVMGGMPSLEDSVGSSVLLLALPQEMFAKRLC